MVESVTSLPSRLFSKTCNCGHVSSFRFYLSYLFFRPVNCPLCKKKFDVLFDRDVLAASFIAIFQTAVITALVLKRDFLLAAFAMFVYFMYSALIFRFSILVEKKKWTCSWEKSTNISALNCGDGFWMSKKLSEVDITFFIGGIVGIIGAPVMSIFFIYAYFYRNPQGLPFFSFKTFLIFGIMGFGFYCSLKHVRDCLRKLKWRNILEKLLIDIVI